MEIQKKLTNLQNIKKSIPSKKNNNNKLSFSSNEIDIEKQDNLPTKKLTLKIFLFFFIWIYEKENNVENSKMLIKVNNLIFQKLINVILRK